MALIINNKFKVCDIFTRWKKCLQLHFNYLVLVHLGKKIKLRLIQKFKIFPLFSKEIKSIFSDNKTWIELNEEEKQSIVLSILRFCQLEEDENNVER